MSSVASQGDGLERGVGAAAIGASLSTYCVDLSSELFKQGCGTSLLSARGRRGT